MCAGNALGKDAAALDAPQLDVVDGVGQVNVEVLRGVVPHQASNFVGGVETEANHGKVVPVVLASVPGCRCASVRAARGAEKMPKPCYEAT